MTRRAVVPAMLAGAVAPSLPASRASARCETLGCTPRGCSEVPDGGRVRW